MQDQEVIALIGQGKDQAAFKALYAHFPKVERLVRANSGTKADAKDVFQDALVIFHRRVRGADFTLTSSTSTFLYAICRNLWREELRKRNKVLTGWDAPETADEPADLTAMVAREGEFKQAEKALHSLGDKCLDLLKRFYLAKEPLMQIAQALGLAGEGAAKTRKYKCLEEARKRYRALAERDLVSNPQHA